MSYYDANLKLLKSTSKVLYEQVTKGETNEAVEYAYDKCNSQYIMIHNNKKVNMHSIINQNFEMEKTLISVNENTRTLIIFGLGNGYVLKYVKRNFPKIEKIILVEPSLTWFRIFLKNYNLAEYVNGVSVSFIISLDPKVCGDQVGQFINNENTAIVFHLSYRIIFEDYYKHMMVGMKNSVVVKASNYAFRREASEALALNFVQNIKHGLLDISCIKDLIKGKPLLIVAAGPSLSKNMHLINKIKSYAIVIAVGSAIKILDSNGIKPHFRMAFDPFSAEKKVVKDLVDYDIPLLFSHTVFFDVLADYSGKKIAIDISSDYGKQYLNKKNKLDYKTVQSASSVAISAVDLGVKYDSTKIILIGFDASFAPDKLYADGIGDSRSEEIAEKLSKPGIYETIDIYGNKVLSNNGFYMNKIGLEVVTEANKEVNFINATEGGLPVKGMRIMTLKDVLDNELDQKLPFEDNLIFEDSDENLTIFKNRIKALFNEILIEISEIDEINNKKINVLKKINKYHKSSIQKKYIENALKDMSKFESELLENDLYKYFILGSLKEIYSGISDLTRYSGFNVYERTTKEIEKHIKRSAELTRYCDFLHNAVKLEMEDRLYELLIKDLNKSE